MNLMVINDMSLWISNDEIASSPVLGKAIKCWQCGKSHRVEHLEGKDAGGNIEPYVLAFMTCGGKSFLCGVRGREWRPKYA